MMNKKTTDNWANIREAGTLFGLKFLWRVHKIFGRTLVSVCLYPTVLYFLIFRRQERLSSQDFLNTHFKQYPNYWVKKPNLFNSAKHFKQFAETVVDKLLSWSVDIDVEKFDIKDPVFTEHLIADSRGQLIIGSHFGNLENCRGFMHRYKDKVINILVHDKHAQNYNKLMALLNTESRLNIFQASEFDIPTMLKIKSKVDQGEWVFIAGDRTPASGTERTVEVQFMGRTAIFPVGPYLLAKALACPVNLMFSYCDYSRHERTIKMDVSRFSEKIIIDRKERQSQLQHYAQMYATALEKQCELSPYQWFNFYKFWIDDK